MQSLLVYCGWLSDTLNPSGIRVLSFSIQKSSLRSRLRVISSLVIWLEFVSCSIKVIFACFSKSWPGVSKKCLSIMMESGLFASDRWLFVLRFDAGSLLPT